MLERYLSNPGKHVYIVFVHKNLVRKMCPVSGKRSYPIDSKQRRFSSEVVKRLAVPSNIVKRVELPGTTVIAAIGTLPTNFPKSELDKTSEKSIKFSRNRC